jgi:DNA-binding transcriptional ArsR family regulator
MTKSREEVLIRSLQTVSEVTRLRLLAALQAGGELCLCQAVALVRLAPSTVSAHLTGLTRAGLAACRREGRWRYYRPTLPPGRDGRWLRALIRRLGQTRSGRADRKRLRALLREEAKALYRQVFPTPSPRPKGKSS